MAPHEVIVGDIIRHKSGDNGLKALMVFEGACTMGRRELFEYAFCVSKHLRRRLRQFLNSIGVSSRLPE